MEMDHVLQLKNRLKAGENVVGTMITIFDHPEMARIMSLCGFDYYLVDAEHGYLNTDRITALFAYGRMAGIPGFMRLSGISKEEISHALDMGADGVVCPNIETAEQARELVRLSKYAPLGERGLSFTRPHTAYRKINPVEYMEQANRSLFTVCQIESPLGVKNIDALVSVEGVDGVLIGPNDLTQQMGIVGQLTNPLYLAAIEETIDGCRRNGKFCGISAKNLSALDYWIERGSLFNQWGSDVSVYMNAAGPAISAWKAESKR